jgi:hypothetical protein
MLAWLPVFGTPCLRIDYDPGFGVAVEGDPPGRTKHLFTPWAQVSREMVSNRHAFPFGLHSNPPKGPKIGAQLPVGEKRIFA